MNKVNYITPAGEVTSKQEESARKQYANDPSDPTRAWFTNVPSVPTGWEIKPVNPFMDMTKLVKRLIQTIKMT